MRNGPWVVVSLLVGGGAFLGGREVERSGSTACPPPPIAAPQVSDRPARVEKSAPPADTPRGRLFIDCTPSRDVKVIVDAKPVGDVCPLEIDAPIGSRVVEVSAPNYRTARRAVVVSAATLAKVALRLEDNAGLFYRDRISFPALKSGAVDDVRDGKVAVVSGRIVNGGDRSVTEVQLAVDFVDSAERVLVRRFIHPVLEANTGALAPGADRSFETKVADVPIEMWSRRIRWIVSLIGVADAKPR